MPGFDKEKNISGSTAPLLEYLYLKYSLKVKVIDQRVFIFTLSASEHGKRGFNALFPID